MAEIKQYTCDGPGCKNVRGEANHWWVCAKTANDFYIASWDRDPTSSRAILHYCGQGCVLKAVAAFMGEK